MVIIGIFYVYEMYHISKRCNSKPCFNAFMAHFLMLNDSVKCPDNKESKYKIMLAEKLKLLANNFSLLSFFPMYFFCLVCLFVICLNVSFITPVPHVLCYLFGCLDSYV